MRVLQAYRFALDPAPRIERALCSHVGARRFAFNWGLALVKRRLDARAHGEEVSVPTTLPALRKEWNKQKAAVAPWWPQNSKEAYAAGLDGLARGLRAFFDSCAGRRKGRRVGFPTFKKKGRGRISVRFTTGAIRVADRTHVVLPRIGRVRTHEATTALLERVSAGTARILSATLSHEAARWYVSFTCEVERKQRRPSRPVSVIGVDAGLQHLAVLSGGEMVPNPRPLAHALRRIAQLNRQLARRARGSRNWGDTRRRLAWAHARVSRIRADAMHKLTTHLARTYGTVVVERLAVAGMMRNCRLARAVADAGLAELRRQLAYKCGWYGPRLIQADTFFPSSKICSHCGAAKATLPLWERIFRCEACGLVLDRDVNAARTLAALAVAVPGSGPARDNARGGDVRPDAVGQTPRTREAGLSRTEGGTAAPQGAAT